MPQLDFAHYPFISQIFWLLVSFAVLYFYAAKIILPRISKTLEMRDRTIETALNEAEKIKVEASKYVAQNEDAVSAARVEAKNIISEAQAQITKKTNNELNKIDKQIAEQLAEAKKKIAKLKKSSETKISKLTDEIYNNLIKNYL